MGSESELDQRLDVAVALARSAGRSTLTHYREEIPVDWKADQSPVTIADREAEKALRVEVASAFPDDGCVGEEFGETPGSNSYTWIFDPIDGTKSFISGVPLFGTLVAVLREGVPVVGVVYFPGLDEMIYGAEGRGAWQIRSAATPEPARVATTASLEDGLFVLTDPLAFTDGGPEVAATYQRLAQTAWLTRTWGDCYGYYLVATGRATVMVDPELKIWDAAPMLPILQEAGGHYSDWDGNRSVSTGSAIATNGLVHQQVLDIVEQCRSGI